MYVSCYGFVCEDRFLHVVYVLMYCLPCFCCCELYVFVVCEFGVESVLVFWV